MVRRIVSRQELDAWLTTEVGKHEDCEGATISIKYLLQKADQTGCNWSDDVNVRVGPNASADYLLPIVAKVVSAAREQFNVSG